MSDPNSNNSNASNSIVVAMIFLMGVVTTILPIVCCGTELQRLKWLRRFQQRKWNVNVDDYFQTRRPDRVSSPSVYPYGRNNINNNNTGTGTGTTTTGIGMVDGSDGKDDPNSPITKAEESALRESFLIDRLLPYSKVLKEDDFVENDTLDNVLDRSASNNTSDNKDDVVVECFIDYGNYQEPEDEDDNKRVSGIKEEDDNNNNNSQHSKVVVDGLDDDESGRSNTKNWDQMVLSRVDGHNGPQNTSNNNSRPIDCENVGKTLEEHTMSQDVSDSNNCIENGVNVGGSGGVVLRNVDDSDHLEHHPNNDNEYNNNNDRCSPRRDYGGNHSVMTMSSTDSVDIKSTVDDDFLDTSDLHLVRVGLPGQQHKEEQTEDTDKNNNLNEAPNTTTLNQVNCVDQGDNNNPIYSKPNGVDMQLSSEPNDTDIESGRRKDTIDSSGHTNHSNCRYVPGGCTICLLEYEANERVVWSLNKCCNHVYHYDCLIDWFNKTGKLQLKRVRRDKSYIRPSTRNELINEIFYKVNWSCPVCRQDFIVMEDENEINTEDGATNFKKPQQQQPHDIEQGAAGTTTGINATSTGGGGGIHNNHTMRTLSESGSTVSLEDMVDTSFAMILNESTNGRSNSVVDGGGGTGALTPEDNNDVVAPTVVLTSNTNNTAIVTSQSPQTPTTQIAHQQGTVSLVSSHSNRAFSLALDP